MFPGKEANFAGSMIRVGKIVATHGINGDVIMTHIAGRKNWLKKGDPIFVAIRKDSHIPYFVTQVKITSEDELIIHLEETESVEAAKKLIGKETFINEEILAKSGAEDSPLLWIGFTLIDESAGELGLIKDVFQTSAQWLAELEYKGNDVLVPLVKPVLQKVDVKARKVMVQLPEGLLEVYE